MKNIFSRIISSTLIASMLSMSIWIPSAQASLISTEQISSNQTAQENRERVRAFFEREDVQVQLQAHGVNSAEAKGRVDAMTDNEVATVAGHLDNLPAGGDLGIIGLILFIFIVLLITDILGLTKVFSFTRSLR